MFIHIKPEETQTIQRIPRALLFPAPGLPKGHVLMGYNDEGHCPMLVDDECSIYEHRPQTCRDYDCRIFAATGVSVDEQTQAEIAHRVKAWEFHYESEAS
jgi:Fe-S-cluster containining protein